MQRDTTWDSVPFNDMLVELMGLAQELPGRAPYQVRDYYNVWDNDCDLQIASGAPLPGNDVQFNSHIKNQLARFIALALNVMPELLMRLEKAETAAARDKPVWIVRWRKQIKQATSATPGFRGGVVIVTDTAPKAWAALRQHVHDTMFGDVPDQYDIDFAPAVTEGVWVTMVMAPSDVSRAALLLREPLVQHEERGMKMLATKRMPPPPSKPERQALYVDPGTDGDLDWESDDVV